MEKILEKNGFSVNDLLPFGEFKLYSDIPERKFSPDAAARIIELAEAELERPLLAIPISSYVGYYNGTAPEVIPVFDERRNGAIILALAESIEGKGRFTNRLLDLVWCILEESIWIHPAHLKDKGICGDPILPPIYENGLTHDVDLRTGLTVGSLAVVYYFAHSLFDNITPVINQRIIREVREKALLPYIQKRFWWSGECGEKVINWGPWITSNMLLAIACIESDENIRRAVFSKALTTINSYTKNYCFDGGCDEGPGYWAASCGTFLDCLDLFYDLSGGKINVYGEPHVRRMFEFAPKYNIHNNQFIAFADTSSENRYSAGMLRRMGEVTGSELLKSFAGFMSKYSTALNIAASMPYSSLRRFYESPVEYCDFKAAKRVWFPDLKVGYSREYEDTSKGMFICMGGGTNGTSHNHNDLGNAIVYYGGSPLLIDMGVGRYNKKTFGRERYTLTTHSSAYHNTVNFGGFVQCAGISFRTENEAVDEKTGFIKMDVTHAYPEEAGVISYVRSTGLEGSVAKIVDEISLNCEKEIDIHFLTHIKPTVNGDGSISLAYGRVMKYDERLSASVEPFEALDDVISTRWGTNELYNIHLKGKISGGVFVTTVE